jgi:hypothetical protein
MKISQEPIKRNSPIEEKTSISTIDAIEHCIARQDHYNKQEQRHYTTKDERTSASLPTTLSTRTNSLTEIDEDDFYYQGPSPYVTTVDLNSISNKRHESSKSSYQIDEYVDEDDNDNDNDERDHVKELEETIANLSRHFPMSSSSQMDSMKDNTIVNHRSQSLNVSCAKIDIDSILEMEIESPSAEECRLQSSMQQPLNIPISVSIPIQNARGSLSRSSGVRENLTDLLATALDYSYSCMPENTESRPLQRTTSTNSKVIRISLFS